MEKHCGAMESLEGTTWEQLASRYDGFIFDLFGVLHNGAVALPGAVDLIQKLKRMDKKLVILSNSSKRSAWALKELSKFGLEASAFQGAITSGKEAWKVLASEKWNGKSCIWLAKADGSGVTEYLEGTGVKLAPEVQEADFILNSGTNTIRTSSATKHVDCETTGDLEQYRDLFCKAIARSLPMICANPDFRSPAKPGAKETFQPGHVARFYEELGGAVTYYGKPGAAHFEAARRLLGYDLAIAHVGDSFFHDVCGATAANVPVVFVAGGIDHQELGIQPGEVPTAKALQGLVERYHVQPNHVVPLAMWS